MSIPMKVIPETAAEESWTTSEERMKELFSHAWDAVKRLTLQVIWMVLQTTEFSVQKAALYTFVFVQSPCPFSSGLHLIS